jgi:hypothetical protein
MGADPRCTVGTATDVDEVLQVVPSRPARAPRPAAEPEDGAGAAGGPCSGQSISTVKSQVISGLPAGCQVRVVCPLAN